MDLVCLLDSDTYESNEDNLWGLVTHRHVPNMHITEYGIGLSYYGLLKTVTYYLTISTRRTTKKKIISSVRLLSPNITMLKKNEKENE